MKDFQLYASAYVIHVVTFWIFGLLFLVLDVLRPQWTLRFKCQPGKYPSAGLVGKVARNVAVNQVTTHVAVFLGAFPLARRRLDFSAELPCMAVACRDLVLFVVLTELEFFFIHRALHLPDLYRRVHKVHHEVTQPFGLCALYFHPFEHAISSLQSFVPALLLGSHIVVLQVWIAVATAMVVIHHSGYDWEPYVPDSMWPFRSMTQQHDFHHAAFSKCFGVVGVSDWLCDTDAGLEERLSTWRTCGRKRAAAGGA